MKYTVEPKDPIPSTIQHKETGMGWVGPAIIIVGLIVANLISFAGGFLVGSGS